MPWSGAVVRHGTMNGATVQTPRGTLSVGNGGGIRLQDKTGQALLMSGTVTMGNDTITVTLTHHPQERFYGAGNGSENHAGDLTHSLGTQIFSRDVYLPAGGWYDFKTGKSMSGGQTLHVHAALDTIPAYVRAGAILPLGPALQSTSLGREDPLGVRVYTYAYQGGEASRIPMHWDDKTRTLTVAARAGAFRGMLSTRHLNFLLPEGSGRSVTYTGKAVQIRF